MKVELESEWVQCMFVEVWLALGLLESQQAVPKLCEILLNDPSPIVREHAATALGNIGNDRAYQSLLQSTRSDDNMVVREHAFSALRKIKLGR